MKKTVLKITLIAFVLSVSAGLALAEYAVCPPAKIGSPVEKQLSAAYCLYDNKQYDKADKALDQVLKEDPGNPVALNNKAAIMVKKGKLDKADTLLNQALESLKKKPCMVQLNRVCSVDNICVAVEPVKMGGGNQDLEPMVKFNIEMVKSRMAALKQPAQ